MTVLELRGVHKEYGSVTALAGVDLRVERGQIAALVGPNGAGKTTVFELLLGLARPTRGTVEVLGRPPGREVRRRVGAMLQAAGLPEHVTARELLRLVGRSYPMSLPVDEVLARTLLAGRADRTVTDLSGGERQRLQLAMALIGAPEVLLLDEPTAALDARARSAFWEQARIGAGRGVTILLATHDLDEAAAVADHVAVIDGGRIVARGAPRELTDHGARGFGDVFLALTGPAATGAGGAR